MMTMVACSSSTPMSSRTDSGATPHEHPMSNIFGTNLGPQTKSGAIFSRPCEHAPVCARSRVGHLPGVSILLSSFSTLNCLGASIAISLSAACLCARACHEW